jgi:hypothetical protein
MENIDLFNQLIIEYMDLHANAKNPAQFIYAIDIEVLIEMLQNANGREIIFTYDDNDTLDGGVISYKEN